MPPPAEESDIGTSELSGTNTEAEPEEQPPGRVRETVVLIVLSITAVLTASCGFESSQWGGEMSIAFSDASSARIEAARQSGVANAARQADLTIWGVYVQARARGDTALARYVEQRFTDHFRVRRNTSRLERPRPQPQTSAPTAASLMRWCLTSAETTTPSSPCSSLWSCSSLLHLLDWAVNVLNGSCSQLRSYF